MAKQKQCFTCHNVFLRDQLIDYASPGTVTLHSYCPECYQQKLDKDKFSQAVCRIFGIKSPGARIWNDRKRLQEQYGYTDNTIVQCLDYIYNVLNKKKQSESLCLVTPLTIEQMKKYYKNQEYQSSLLVNSTTQEKTERHIEIKENIQSHKNKWNPDDWIEDGEEC